eukprot:TRINITY_DN64302_c0_g1_i1.p1 TRINITY_DN64302_c0_g1~~TRINITY_DN64302_c0_g1_i1.p1  ORF type:complete len:382 (-),score=91.58 TRINITY_DN64302_c0_g1_i1:8-1123(-)
MAACTACNKCGAVGSELGRKLLVCGRCKGVAYCSAECQRADWKVHKYDCSAPKSQVMQKESVSEAKSPLESMDTPFWGGALTGETTSERLRRVLDTSMPPPSSRRQEDRCLKAKELFRLGISLSFQDHIPECLEGIAEGYLLADTAAPEVLAQYLPDEKFNGNLLSYILESVKARVKGSGDELRYAFLKMRWLDIKLKAQHTLLNDSQFPDDAAMKDWFETLEYFLAYGKHICSKFGAGDRRILSRVTLDVGKNVYKQDPPDLEMVRKSIDLWPEDYVARSWGKRHEDIVALVGDLCEGSDEQLLEFDSKWYGKFCYELAWSLKDTDAALARRYLQRAAEWEKLPEHEFVLRSWPDIVRKKTEAIQTLSAQ